jgi:predicted nucleic acid-binding protein
VKVVVDASVIVKWFVQEDGRDAARHLVKLGCPCEAPELAIVEVAGALSLKVRANTLTWDQALASLRAMPDGTDVRASAAFIEMAMNLSVEIDHHINDCLYLALALSEDKMLVTADVKFLNKLALTKYKTQVIRLDVSALNKADAKHALGSIESFAARVTERMSPSYRDEMTREFRRAFPGLLAGDVQKMLQKMRSGSVAGVFSPEQWAFFQAMEAASTSSVEQFGARRFRDEFNRLDELSRVSLVSLWVLGADFSSIDDWLEAKEIGQQIARQIDSNDGGATWIAMLLARWHEFDRGVGIVRAAIT